MNELPKFQVTLPSGQKTKPYDREKITAAMKSGKLPADATVMTMHGTVSVEQFCMGRSPVRRSAPAVAQPVLIQQTSKPLKAMRAAGIVLILLSVVVGVLFSDSYGIKEGWPLWLTCTLAVAGFLTFGVGVLLSWWHHA